MKGINTQVITRKELVKAVKCGIFCKDRVCPSDTSCLECVENMIDEYEKQIAEEAYKEGYTDARDKYEKQENPIQMFRRSGHP